MKRFEARLSGLGGQGVILAGIILAEAAGIHEGRKVVQTQSYGPESRGSACKCDVIIGDQEIKYPGVYRLNMLVALSQDACDKYAADLVEGGLLLYDPLYVKKLPERALRAHAIAATEIAEGLGRKIAANMVALGAVAALADLVSPDSLAKAVVARSPKGTDQGNLDAFQAGLAAARGQEGAAQ
ncbi:MAG: 2-oxoacid:acceptor oxidoreductase family protein [Chloroflexota bacterium]